MTAEEAGQLVGRLKALYPRQAVSEATIAGYIRYLCDLDYQAVSDAVDQHIATSPFFPTVAELRTVAAERKLELPPPLVAWNMAVHAALNGKMSTLPDEVYQAALAVGGSHNIRYSEQPDMLRAHFLKGYAEIRSLAVEKETVEPIVRGELTEAVAELAAGIAKEIPE